MRGLVAVLCVGLSLLVGGACAAATIDSVQGDLSINRRQGFEKVNGRVESNLGYAVSVSPDGAASVTYPDGCQANVAPGAVMTIGTLSPCASGSLAQGQNQSNNNQCTNNAECWLIVGGIAAITGFIIFEATRPSPSPASP